MIENMKVEFGRTSDIDSWMCTGQAFLLHFVR